MIIGITGKIGSGKTTIGRIFEKYGAFVIDADIVGHKVLEEKKEEILKAFGTIERKTLADIVFKDKNKLEKLNKITHPLIIKKIKNLIKHSKGQLIVVAAPFLIETELKTIVDKTILIICDKDIILKRMKKGGWEISDVLRRMKNQPNDSKRIPFSDIIIDNNGPLSKIEKRIKKIIKEELRFKLFEHTADIGIIAFGNTKERLFENCSYGMFSILADLSNVRCCERIKISSSGNGDDEMLVNTLSELLFCFTGKGYLLKKFKTEIIGNNVSVLASGEQLSKNHILKMEIKTVTYHNLEIKKRKDGWIARVIFDV
ncbi:MAG: dephospho-CoA kinase, partial [bacterium]